MFPPPDPPEQSDSYMCIRCGERHSGVPLSYGSPAPVAWSDEFADRDDSVLEDDHCIVRAEHFFVKGCLLIPVTDTGQTFNWNVWVSLSRENMTRTLDLWTTEGRESEEPYFGWLSTELSLVYGQSTLSMRTHVVTQRVGLQPHIHLEDADHPLFAEWRNGMTMDRVREIAAIVMHG